MVQRYDLILLVTAQVFVMKLSIVIPAYNEENRIGRTLEKYVLFSQKMKKEKNIDTEFPVVLNGCTDNTLSIVRDVQKKYAEIRIIDLKNAGKGFAVAAGFKDAVARDNDLIGFVDADMATKPEYFYELAQKINDADGIIASRYMKKSKIFPPRPGIKEWGRIIVYNPIIRLLFGMSYVDFQCGAKLFKRSVIEAIANKLTVRQWAFDVELLHLCKTNHFTIKEIPTVWYDQDDSKFNLKAGMCMIGRLFALRFGKRSKH